MSKSKVRTYLEICQDSTTETWEEHKKHYHGGKEPTGECKELDKNNADAAIQETTIFDTIKRAKEIAKELINEGKRVHQRVPTETLRKGAKGNEEMERDERRGDEETLSRLANPKGQVPLNDTDRVLAEAHFVARHNEGRSDKSAPHGGDKYRALKQVEDLRVYAASEGLLHDNIDNEYDKLYGEHTEGGESYVWMVPGGKKVIKLLSNMMYTEPVLNLDRIELFNLISPETALKITGFGKTKEPLFGYFSDNSYIEVEQPYVKQKRGATLDETIEYMRNLGFTTDFNKAQKLDRDGCRGSINFYNNDKSIVVSDLHDENVVITDDDNIVLIDADIRLNTPNIGGEYIIPK